MSGFAAPLLIADHRQQRTQPLVVGDRTLVDLSDFVEGAVGQLDTPIADRQPAVGRSSPSLMLNTATDVAPNSPPNGRGD